MARVAEARDDREQREEDHQRADAEDEGDVARLDAPADDVGHERRLDDLADDVEQHERDGDHDRLFIGREVRDQFAQVGSSCP